MRLVNRRTNNIMASRFAQPQEIVEKFALISLEGRGSQWSTIRTPGPLASSEDVWLAKAAAAATPVCSQTALRTAARAKTH